MTADLYHTEYNKKRMSDKDTNTEIIAPATDKYVNNTNIDIVLYVVLCLSVKGEKFHTKYRKTHI